MRQLMMSRAKRREVFDSIRATLTDRNFMMDLHPPRLLTARTIGEMLGASSLIPPRDLMKDRARNGHALGCYTSRDELFDRNSRTRFDELSCSLFYSMPLGFFHGVVAIQELGSEPGDNFFEIHGSLLGLTQ